MQEGYGADLLDAVNAYELNERVEVILCTTLMCVYGNPHLAHGRIREQELRSPFTSFWQRSLGEVPVGASSFCVHGSGCAVEVDRQGTTGKGQNLATSLCRNFGELQLLVFELVQALGARSQRHPAH